MSSEEKQTHIVGDHVNTCGCSLTELGKFGHQTLHLILQTNLRLHGSLIAGLELLVCEDVRGEGGERERREGEGWGRGKRRVCHMSQYPGFLFGGWEGGWGREGAFAPLKSNRPPSTHFHVAPPPPQDFSMCSSPPLSSLLK